MSIRDTKKSEIIRRIKAAARSRFVQDGYAATSMEKIAADAGISRASLFNYFAGKSVLLAAIGDELEGRLVGAVRHYLDKHQAAPAALEALFSHAAQVLEQTAGLTELLVRELGAANGFPALQAELIRLVEVGQAAGDWRSDIPAVQLSEPVYLGFLAGLLNWCRQPGVALSEQFSERVHSLNTLLAP